MYLEQKDNAFEFDESVEEFEEMQGSNQERSPNDLSEENFFLSMILMVVIFLGILLYITRKKQ